MRFCLVFDCSVEVLQFSDVLKIIFDRFGFALLRSVIGLKIHFCPHFQQIKTNCDSLTRFLSRLASVTFMSLSSDWLTVFSTRDFSDWPEVLLWFRNRFKAFGAVTLGNFSCNFSRNFVAPLRHR